jgi:hypothetical protein
VLVLGTGEFMHAATCSAPRWNGAAWTWWCSRPRVRRSSTWGAVGRALTFPDNYGEGIANFIYNVAPGQYDHVLVCHETPPTGPARAGGGCDARLFHFQPEDRVEEIPVR